MLSIQDNTQPATPEDSALETALAYASVGYLVFPLHYIEEAAPREVVEAFRAGTISKAEAVKHARCSCGKANCTSPGKHPLLDGGPRIATTDEAQIRKWFEGKPWNVGIRMPPGLLCLDFDLYVDGARERRDEIAAAQPTRAIQRSGGGEHHIYICPEGHSFAATLDGKAGVDIIHHGNRYIVASPSKHWTGATYEWIDYDTPAPASATLLARCQPRKLGDGSHEDLECEEGSLLDEARAQRLFETLSPVWERDGRQAWVLGFFGWLLGKRVAGWPVVGRDDLRLLVGRLVDEVRDEGGHRYAEMVERAHALSGPSDAVREALGDAFAEVDRSFDLDLGPWRERREARAALTAANDATIESTAQTELQTDLGNARRLVRMHGARLRYVSDRGVWLVWNGACWGDDDTGQVERCAKDALESLWSEAKLLEDDDKRNRAFRWAAECQSRSRIANAINLAKSEPSIAVRVGDLDADPWLLNVANGTLDLRTGYLRQPDPALLMTKSCGTYYDREARSDLWDAFIDRTFKGDRELIAYVQRALGYALFGEWREKAFWFGHGPADGGKSTMFAVVSAVLGSYAVAADAETWVRSKNPGGNRGDLTRLLGARLVLTSEMHEGMRIDERLVKGVTGGDPIVAAAKYEGQIAFRPSFALWWFSNFPPIIRDDDDAIWSRARVVPFTNPVPAADQIRGLDRILASPTHAPAVLAWLVEGCLAWQRDGIGTCSAVEVGTAGYRSAMNRAASFLDECVEITRAPNDRLPKTALRAAYDQWCRRNGVRNPMSAEALAARIRALGVDCEDNKAPVNPGLSPSTYWFTPPKRDRHWVGLRLID